MSGKAKQRSATTAATGAGPGAADAGSVDGPPARQRILDAAETLFAERGFDRTSTASIAVEAGVPSGLVFYHFRTKMELLLAVVRPDGTTGFDLDMPTVPATGDLRTQITAIWDYLVATLGEPSALRKIVLQELSAHPEVRQRALELQTQITDAVSERLARATGHHSEPLPEHRAAAGLLTMTVAMASVYDRPAGSLIDPDALALLLEHGLHTPDREVTP